MAHAPEFAELFVCGNCQTVHAGTPVRDDNDDGHSYRAPTACGACAESNFVAYDKWEHHYN